MAHRIVCYPPLNQTTVVAGGEDIHFTVALEIDSNSSNQNWEAVLWHSTHNEASADWNALPLPKVETASDLEVDPPLNKDSTTHFFHNTLTDVSAPRQLHFTIKFRNNDQEWRWVKECLGKPDGEVRIQAHSLVSSSLQTYLPNLDEALQLSQVKSSGLENVIIWEIGATVPAATDPYSGSSTQIIGKPSDFTHWFALVRHSTAWIAPRQGRENISLDGDAILCSFLRKDGFHLVLLAVTLGDVLTAIKTNEHGELLMVGKNDALENGYAVVVASLGPTFEIANAAAMTHVEQVVRRSYHSLPPILNDSSDGSEKASEQLQRWYDGLTYCTWNALGQDIDENKVHDALGILQENNLPITNVIIDDGWQSLDHPGEDPFFRGWSDFEAYKEGFPGKLRGLSSKIRQNYPSVQHVGVWHGIFGYWGGVSPDGHLSKCYRTKRVPKERDYHSRDSFLTFEGCEVHQVYDDFYEFLRDSGIDSTKADNRHHLDCLSASNDRREMIREYNKAWLTASAKHFCLRVVLCMAMIPQVLFSPELIYKRTPSQSQQKIVMRNSDDFFPEEPSSHLWHIFWNAHNAVFTQHLHVLPDWDIFQTVHEYAGFHAAARCVSGGPIQITDYPGKHSLPLVRQIIANKSDGSTIILRPSTVGRSTDVYSAHSEGRFCKVSAYHEIAHQRSISTGGIAILGIFNMSPKTHTEFVPLSDFREYQAGKIEYVIRSYVTGKIMGPLSEANGRSAVKVELANRGYDVLTLCPLISLSNERKIAVLGLLGHMSGAAAVTSLVVETSESTLSIKLKALGSFGLFIDGLDRLGAVTGVAKLNGKTIPDAYHEKEKLGKACLLRFNLNSAWQDLGLEDQEILLEFVL